VADGAIINARAVDPVTTAGGLSAAAIAAAPQVPKDVDPQAASRGNNWIFIYRSPSSLPPPTQQTGVLEKSLLKLHLPSHGDWLAPRSYIAIVEQSPEVELGTIAREESSFHVIYGKW
jgi:hypothetical protein